MKKKITFIFNFIKIWLGLMLILFSPELGNFAELHSVYGDITRSYFTFIAYTISTAILGLAIFLAGIIGYYVNSEKFSSK